MVGYYRICLFTPRMGYYICLCKTILLKKGFLNLITSQRKTEILNDFKNKSREIFDCTKDKYNLEEAMESGVIEDVRDTVKGIQNIMIGSIPEGVDIPKVSTYISASGEDAISLVNIKITNRVKSDKTFAYPISVTKGKATEKVFDYMVGVYTALIVDQMVCENLAEVNGVLAEAVKEAKLPYSIKVVSDLGNEGKKIALLSDDEVIFVADEDRVFSLDNIIVLLTEATDLISEETIKAHFDALVEELATASTTVQLMGIYGGALVAYVCDISKRTRPATLIKKVCSKNVKNLYGKNDILAYYSEGDTFALVSRRDGDFEVILSPFDINTLLSKDVDVLKAIS